MEVERLEAVAEGSGQRGHFLVVEPHFVDAVGGGDGQEPLLFEVVDLVVGDREPEAVPDEEPPSNGRFITLMGFWLSYQVYMFFAIASASVVLVFQHVRLSMV